MCDCCFGEGVARRFIQELRRKGLRAEEETGQEDLGWYLNLTADEVDYYLLLSCRPAEGDGSGDWMGTQA